MMNLRHSTIGTHHLDSLSCEVFWQTLVIPVNHQARGTPPHRLDCLTLYRVHSPLEGGDAGPSGCSARSLGGASAPSRSTEILCATQSPVFTSQIGHSQYDFIGDILPERAASSKSCRAQPLPRQAHPALLLESAAPAETCGVSAASRVGCSSRSDSGDGGAPGAAAV